MKIETSHTLTTADGEPIDEGAHLYRPGTGYLGTFGGIVDEPATSRSGPMIVIRDADGEDQIPLRNIDIGSLELGPPPSDPESCKNAVENFDPRGVNTTRRAAAPELRVIKGGKRPPKLYYVTTTVPKFEHKGAVYQDVQISWFVADRTTPVAPYHELIDRYETLVQEDECWMVQQCVDEMFTEDEAAALLQYLGSEHPGNKDDSREAPTPYPARNENGGGWMPTGGIPVGGSSDYYMLHKEPEYRLSFEVMGYFDVRGYPYTIDPATNTAPENFPPWAQRHGSIVLM